MYPAEATANHGKSNSGLDGGDAPTGRTIGGAESGRAERTAVAVIDRTGKCAVARRKRPMATSISGNSYKEIRVGETRELDACREA